MQKNKRRHNERCPWASSNGAKASQAENTRISSCRIQIYLNLADSLQLIYM